LATGGNEGVLRVFDILEPEKKPLEFVMNKDEVCLSRCTFTCINQTFCLHMTNQQKGRLYLKMQLDRQPHSPGSLL
jgi:hypothetical protein